MILLDLPIPPSMNDYWRPGPNRSRTAAEGSRVMYVTSKGKKYRKEVTAEWIAQRNRRPLSGPLFLRGWIWFERRGSDVDNRIKPLLDALEEAGCFENDRQISAVFFRRMDATMKPGSVIVHVEPDAGDRVRSIDARASWREVWAALGGR